MIASYSRHIASIALLTCALTACDPNKQNGAFGMPLPKEEKLLEQAKAAYDAGRLEQAEEKYLQLVEAKPGSKRYLMGVADLKRFQRQTDAAREYYDKILKIDPDDVAALEGKGLAYMEDANFTLAIKQFTHVLELDATRWRSMNAVGVAFDITKRPDEAQDYYKTALEVKPEEPMVLNNYALSYAFQGNYKEAIATMKRAVVRLSKAEDKKRRAELNLSLIYGLAGMMEPAEVLLRKHLPEPLVYNNLGMYAHLANDNDLAQTYLHKAVMESPTFYQKAWETLKVVEPLVSKEE